MHATRRLEIGRVDLGSLFKIAFVLYATLGLVAGLFYALVIMVVGQFGAFLGDEDIPGLGYLTGIVGVLAVPVLAMVYGVMGSIVVTIGGAIYNFAVRMMGGLRFDVRDDSLETRPVSTQQPPTG